MLTDNVLQPILKDLAAHREALAGLREILLANAVMCGEIPSPTFGEDALVRFLCDRFTESGLQNISTDEKGNAIALIPGGDGKRTILVAAHIDKIWERSIDHTVSVTPERIVGPGIADNSLGAAVLASLPAILDHLAVRLKSNLVLLGTTRSMGKGDLAGLRFFIDNTKIPVHAAVCVEGVEIGRLSYASLGMIRAEISVRTEEERDWQRSNGSGAIVALNRVIDEILSIETPGRPRTSIILGSILAGNAYNVAPTKATLRFEVRSEQPGMVARIHERIAEIVERVNAEDRVKARLDVIARRHPGGIDFSHPMVKATRAIMGALGIEPKVAPSTNELSALVDKGIPGVTLGITRGEQKHSFEESVEVEPVFSGIAQLVGVLRAIDGGICDE